jgi:hypothetical protein
MQWSGQPRTPVFSVSQRAVIPKPVRDLIVAGRITPITGSVIS